MMYNHEVLMNIGPSDARKTSVVICMLKYFYMCVHLCLRVYEYYCKTLRHLYIAGHTCYIQMAGISYK